MIEAFIIEDEAHGSAFIQQIVEDHYKDIKIIGIAATVDQGIELLKEMKPDLIFLDIELPDGNAFDLLLHFPILPWHIIFITAYEQYAIKAIKMDIIDYILKPINIKELLHSIDKAKKMIVSMKQNNRAYDFLHEDKLILPSLTGMDFVEVKSIIRCEAESNYTKFYFTDRSPLLVSKTMGKFEEILTNKGFMRVHHKHMINLKHVVKYNKGKSGYVILSDNAQIDISVRKRAEFLKMLAGDHQL
jgi:two-component system, LytTR family, response regulator